MTKYYGHHPSPDIVDPVNYYNKTEVITLTQEASANAYNKSETLTEEASANAYNQANDYTDTLVATVSAATLDEANNGWWKENFTMTTITSGASGRPIGIVFDEHVVIFKVHVAAIDTAPGAPGEAGAWHIEAAFQKSLPVDARQLGPTIVVFEQKDNANWDVDFGLQGIAQEVVEIQVEGDVGQTVRWTVAVEWFLGSP